MTRSRWSIAWQAAMVALVLTLPLGVHAQQAKNEVTRSSDGKSWTVNIRNADIQAFISQVAEMTGKNFVIDPRVRARDVTVISNKPLSSDEVYQLFLSVLQVHGYAAVPAGNVIKIVTNTTAKQSNLPLTQSTTVDGEELITQVIPVDNSPVEELVPVLRPLVPQYGHLAAVGSANALIISDHADNIGRIRAIIQSLDGAESDDVEIVQLKHAFAGNMVALLQELTKPDPGNRRAANQSNATVVADERTNRLIIKGDRGTRARLLPLISKLDTPSAAAGGVQVVRLSHGDAEKMADLLKNFAEGASAVKQGDTKGSPAATAGGTSATARVSIQADVSLNALVIRAEPEMMRELQSVISQLDVRRAQILIEAAIVEVTGDKASSLGFQYVAGSGENGIGAVNFNNSGVSIQDLLSAVITEDPSQISLGDGLAAGFGKTNSNGDLEWGALVQALASTTNTNLLSTPSILTLDNQEASIIVGENVPFVTGQASSTGSGVSNPFTTIQREDVGLTLKVTPHVAGLNTIRLELEQETSAVKDSVGEAVDIVTTKRKLTTTVLADDGETIALGGLISDDVQDTVRKVPLLGDIPLLGVLFRSTSKSHVKRNLMIFIKPTVLVDNERLVDMTREKYMGVTAMQFRVDEDGNLVRDTAFPLPTRASQLFDGRSPVSEDYRKAYEREQNKSVDESAAPSTSEPVIENEGFLPGVKEESPQEERREERQDDDRGDDQAARGGEAPSPRS
ncbi:type II secretion system secretin GspD [Alloalcanivorax mobilis]|uniref:type II secretion system secretin GspD n=1 Tax=Alloalcanivorax mobilis TaxID=2019569 RepID=UPI001E325DD5|nr:type II secretion system secretin GspD [Alloalcanivorax mobilis]